MAGLQDTPETLTTVIGAHCGLLRFEGSVEAHGEVGSGVVSRIATVLGASCSPNYLGYLQAHLVVAIKWASIPELVTVLNFRAEQDPERLTVTTPTVRA